MSSFHLIPTIIELDGLTYSPAQIQCYFGQIKTLTFEILFIFFFFFRALFGKKDNLTLPKTVGGKIALKFLFF